MKKYLFLVALCGFMLTSYTFAQQAGDLDPTFGEAGLVHFPNEERIKDVATLPDGKILVLGDSILYCLNADGTADVSFGNNGTVNPGCLAGYVKLMPDDVHFIVTVANSCDNNLKVYDTSGNLVSEMAISGCRISLTPISSERIRFLGCDGNIRDQNIFDSNDFFTFPDGVPVTGESRKVRMARGEDYTITLGATPTSGYDPMNMHINKITDDSLTTEWTYSEVFGGSGMYVEPRLNVYDVFIQSDGKILYYYSHVDDYNSSRYIKRLNADGSIDDTFNTITFWGVEAGCDCSRPQDVALNSSDEIIVSLMYNGFAQGSQLEIYGKNGGFASWYAGSILNGMAEDSAFYLGNIAIQADNSVFAVGRKSTDYFTNNTGFVSKFNVPICHQGGITFTSQTQVDSFSINYPDCDRIKGDVVINSNTITNLYGLNNIRFIDGNFKIYDNPLLGDIYMGLFHNLEVSGDVVIKNNDALQVAYANIIFNGALFIEDNDALYDISGLDNFGTAEQMTYLKITNNPQLWHCTLILLGGDSYSGFCTYLYNDGAADIYDNAAGCNSVSEVVNNCDFLPIELTDFQAQVENKTILLTWTTATEINNEGFEIQRSKDGATWEKIAWQTGQGTSTTPYTYTHRDTNPLFGTSYYRLKQVDFDGTYDYSDVVKVDYAGNRISIYPNPVKKTLYIADTNGSEIASIAIYDQMGKQLIQQNEIENAFDVSSLSSGMYIIKIAFESGVFCEKLIVE